MSILVHRGQDRRPVLNSHHLYTSRLQCIKTKHNSVVEINAWTLEPLLKSNATVLLSSHASGYLSLPCTETSIC